MSSLEIAQERSNVERNNGKKLIINECHKWLASCFFKKVNNTCFCMNSLYRNCICIVLLGMVYKFIVIYTHVKHDS